MIVIALVLVITLVIGYISFYYTNKQSASSSVYTPRGFWLTFHLRWLRWVAEVWFLQRHRRPRLNNYRLNTRDFKYCGILPTPEEVQLEQPFPLTTERHEDGVTIWGTDGKGQAVYARVVRLAGNRTSVILVIRDAKGLIYTLPDQPDSSIIHTDASTWRGGGLLLECVQPMRTWRLKFNGSLRRGPRPSYTTELSPADDEGVVEARLDLVWRALRPPVDIFRDSDPRLLATALAREPDADLRYFTSLDRDAYDQAGALSGLVQLDLPTAGALTGAVEDSNTEFYWYLRGSRQRRWGMGEAATQLHRSVEFLTFFDNGDSFYQFTFCYPNSLTHCQFGYLETAAGNYKPLSDISLQLAEVGEDGTIPSHVFFDCKGGFSTLHACVSLSKGSAHYYSGDPWTLRHDVVFTDTFVGSRKGAGIAVFTRSYSGLCPVPEQYSGSLLAHQPEESTEDVEPPLVASIKERASLDAALTGGKGASLAFLSALDGTHAPEKVRVPRGVIVTRAAWRLQLQQSQVLTTALQSLSKAVGFGQDNQIKEACSKCTDLFLKEPVCQAIKDAVVSGLEKHCPSASNNARFAVRSSGSDEDGGEASAAGQNLTLLGCVGTDQILSAIPKCWASLVSFNSLQYRRQRGLDPVGEMAVVVQEMVDADIAGVIFTRHPITGSPSSVTITANYGLGESVVSGSSDPDTITVSRSWRNTLRVQSSVVGQKASKHVLSCSGTQETPVPQSDRDKCCVSEALAIRLARMAVHVEQAYLSARDIEFAVVNDEIFLLQARPITSLDTWTELELLTELDGATVCDQAIRTRANTGEVFPQASTPLTVSVVGKALDLAIQKTVRSIVPLRRYKVDPTNQKAVAYSFMHAWLDVIESMLIVVEDSVAINNITTDFGIFGHRVTTEEHVRLARERHGKTNVLETAMALITLLYRTLSNGRVMSQAKEQFQHYNIRTERALTAQGLLKKISLRLPELIAMSHVHGIVSSTSSATQNIAFIMLTEGANDVSAENIADMAKMLAASCEGQESAGVPSALKQLADTISRDEEAAEFLLMTPDEGNVWLESHPGAVGDHYQLFLDMHGHRCIQELEISSLSWGMDGRGLVKTLQTMASLPKTLRKEDNKPSSVADILASLSSPIKKNTYRGLEFFLPVCRSSVKRREFAKSYTAKVINAFRKAYRTLGELMVAEGRLPDSNLLFYLMHHELQTLLRTRSPGLIAKAVKRKKLRSKLLKISLPEIAEGRYNPFSEVKEDQLNSESCEVVNGTAVCVGKVVGPAIVVHNLEEATNIKSGDILITYSTDVGWTPYFPLLSGVVTEIGGLISHGAVVAREYGLPCVVGAVGATKLINSGDLIELNGSTGKITKLNRMERDTVQTSPVDR